MPSIRSSLAAILTLIAVAAPVTSARAQCPPAPSLSATPIGCGVFLSWTFAPFATSYNIYRSTSDSSNGALIGNTDSTTSSDTPPLLPAGQLYYYRVVGTTLTCAAAGHEGAYSAAAPAAPVHMAAPTFTQINPGCGTITFSWNPVPGATSYRLSHMFLNNELSFSILPASQISYTYTYPGVSAPPTDFGVAAIGACETGPRSLVGATISSPADSLLNYTVTGQCNGIRLDWPSTPRHAEGIRILRTAIGFPDYTFVYTGAATLILDTSVLPGVTYFYTATPFNSECGNAASVGGAAMMIPFSAPALLDPVRATPGQTAHLNASTAGVGNTPVSYQWKRNGVNVTNGGRISGANTAALTITDARPEDSDIFTITATNNACADSFTSTIALVVVNTCPADFNHSGGLEVQDIFDFLNAWFARCP